MTKNQHIIPLLKPRSWLVRLLRGAGKQKTSTKLPDRHQNGVFGPMLNDRGVQMTEEEYAQKLTPPFFTGEGGPIDSFGSIWHELLRIRNG